LDGEISRGIRISDGDHRSRRIFTSQRKITSKQKAFPKYDGNQLTEKIPKAPIGEGGTKNNIIW
jgi:hypothetical protein